MFEDIEIDFAGKLYKEQLQNRADDTFRYVPRKRQVVLNADCGRYGRYLGNQHHEPATDLSGFRVRYENLTFRRIECLGNVPELKGRIDASSAPHTIEGVTLCGLPDTLDVNVNGIAPGYIATDNTAALHADPVRSRQILERIPAGR